MVHQVLTFSSGKVVEQMRDGNSIASENDSYMYLYKTDGHTQNYLNYRAVYGLRYSPSKKLSTSPDIVTTHQGLEQPFNDSIPSEFNSASENVNDEVASSNVESETVVLDGTSSSFTSQNFTFGTAEPAVDESRNHIMRPNNRVEYALDFLANRLKKLLYYSSDYNRPESKVSPQLTSLGKVLNLFSLIKFENIPCLTAQKPLRQLSGTCYSEADCANLGGLAVDRCASGFGVCCVCESRFIDFFSSLYVSRPKR